MSTNNEFKPQGLKHGGRVLAAAEKYAIPKDEWLDLSTGLNPNSWPVPVIPDSIWQALPEDNDGLQTAACNYYGCDACLVVSGSQAAIQTLPTLRSASKVAVISPTYAEHEYNWKQAGHDVIQLSMDQVDDVIEHIDVLVVINPNNPSGDIVPVHLLLEWHQKLSTKGGWLIVDEAFMDITPEKSLLTTKVKPGLIVLRSLGKFFGLAGVRCGFVVSDKELLQRLADKLGPWSVTGPTRYIAKQALADQTWHVKTRNELILSSQRLHQLLSEHGLLPTGSTSLFQWVKHPKAKEIYKYFAKQGILLRYFDKSNTKITTLPSLRFGLPADEKQWSRLNHALLMLTELTKNKEKKPSYV